MFAIEIDGLYHNNVETIDRDDCRQQKLEGFGITVIRFSESDVKYDILNVLREIENTIIEILKQNRDVKLPKGFDCRLLE